MEHSGCFFARVVRFRRRSVGQVRPGPIQPKCQESGREPHRTAPPHSPAPPRSKRGRLAIRPRMRSPCVVTLSPAFPPVQTPQSHPSERHVTGRCEQEEPSSEQVAAGATRTEVPAGGGISRTRRRGFVFATVKTRIGHLSYAARLRTPHQFSILTVQGNLTWVGAVSDRPGRPTRGPRQGSGGGGLTRFALTVRLVPAFYSTIQ